MSTWTTPAANWRSGVPGGNLPPAPGGTPMTPYGDGAGGRGRPMATLATYPDYPAAQRAVDFLADNRFPVEHTSIVGTDLALVETVLGRMSTGRAALVGAGTGAWFGLFIGLLFGIFTAGNWLAVIIVGLVVGAIWGAVFGAVTHAMGGGRRDFNSSSSLQARRYAVTVDADVADQARQMLDRMPGDPPPEGSAAGSRQVVGPIRPAAATGRPEEVDRPTR